MGNGEEIDDVFSITGEFLLSVRKGKESGSDCPIPHNRPVSTIFDNFRWLNRSKGNLEVSEFLNFGVIVHSGKLSAEDCVEVDCSTRNNILPF